MCIQRCMCVHLCIFLMFNCLCIDNSSFLCSPPQPSRRFFPPPMPLSKPGKNNSLILYITGLLLKMEVVVYSWGIQDTRNVHEVSGTRGTESVFSGSLASLCVLFLFLLNLLCEEVLLGSLEGRMPFLRCWPYSMRSGYGSSRAYWALNWKFAYSLIASSFCSLTFSFSESVLLKWSLVFFA